MAIALSKQTIDALVMRARTADSKQLELVDDRVSGLRIRAGARSATWMLSSRLTNGKRSRIKLGAWPSMGISDARKAAQILKLKLSSGGDPNEAKRDTVRKAAHLVAKQRTLHDILDQYEATKLVQLRCGAAVRRALDGKRGLLRAFVDREPATIVRADIAEAVREHAIEAPIAANRNLAYARAFFNWCVADEIIGSNPAATIKKPAKERQRDRYHSLEELREIWLAAGTLGYPFGPFYQLQILLPMRREELAAMPITELQLGSDELPCDAVWTLPSERTKRANALRVPLSKQARAIIKMAISDHKRPPGSPFVFSMTGDTPASGFTKAKRRLDCTIMKSREKNASAMNIDVVPMPHWTVHDLRTTFSTQACDVLEIEIAVADRILNHVASSTISKICRVYNKSELFAPRKRALAAWATLVETTCIETEFSEV